MRVMTNQEAIERIKEHIAIHKYTELHAIHIVEALEMAISALQAQPDVSDTDGDMVSRKLMLNLGATCIARRDDDGKLIALGRIDMLPPAQSEQQWIPIKEGPPKKEGDCLVQCKYLEMPFIAWFGIDPRYPRGNNNCVQKFWCDDCEDDLMPLDDVIAWMPLPKPYKEDES